MVHAIEQNRTLVSIIVPIYNAQLYLGECLNSILLQSFRNYEVLCVDDGSTDNSGKICRDFSQQDSRIKYLQQTNSGVSAARNLGLDNAIGDYVCFIDADDAIHKEFLSTLTESIMNHDAVICDFTRSDNFGRFGKTIECEPKNLILDVIFERIKHPGLYCFLYKRSIIESNNVRFTEGCIKNEDTEFYIKYLAVCKNSIALTDYIGYFYRSNPTSVMAAPITEKAFTSIEAAKRINQLLFLQKIIDDKDIVLSNSILVYAYGICKQHDKHLYDRLHDIYDVRHAMIKMLGFPRMSKRIVAGFYLLLGKKAFFTLIGIIRMQLSKRVKS